MKDILESLESRRETPGLAAGRRASTRSTSAASSPARERIELLLDHGSFEEYDMFVQQPLHRLRHGQGRQDPRDGVVTGWGTVTGASSMCFAKDFTVFGGSLSETHARRSPRSRTWRWRNRAPIIGLFDAGGARIQEAWRLGGLWRGVSSATCFPRASFRRYRSSWALRGRRRVFAGDDRLHLHGARHELHVSSRGRTS